MRVNQPVTQREFEFRDELLVSTTDARGHITHCNAAFCHVSGYTYEELIGQPHNMVRHPDMPEIAFKDMWSTIGRGRPWTGIVKNRRKDGDHYWVKANVTPVMEKGKPVGYMSVRECPSRDEVREAEQLYQRLEAEKRAGRATIKLHAGRVRALGLRDLPARVHRLNITERLALGLMGVLGLALLSVPYSSAMGAWGPLLVAALGSCALVGWFHVDIQKHLDEAENAANMIASCNLRDRVRNLHPHPLSGLTRALAQIQINLRAVIGDAREEVRGTVETTAELSKAGQDLSNRTEAQASAVQRTAATMEQIATTVRQTAATAAEVASEGAQASGAAQRSGVALEQVTGAFAGIEASSKRIGEVVQVIESIAFQTNILALNAAVEAARAGDQGRGFAVVASEVRALAQRSAGAAKEVRSMIESSGRQVDDGSRFMQAANETITRTVSQVDRVGQMIAEINRATTEQSNGIVDVNHAVSQLDQMTQENSAMVEQTAAAVESLHQRSDTLRRSLEVFRA